MESRELCAKLGGVGLCQGLTAEELGRLVAAGRVEEAPDGTVLLKEGEPPTAMLILLDGEVSIIKGDDAGHEHQLATIGAGAILGEVGLLETVPRTATARAISPTRYFVLDQEAFNRLVEESDSVALGLSLAIARSLSLRLKQMNDRIVELLDEEAPTRPPAELHRFRKKLLSDWNF